MATVRLVSPNFSDIFTPNIEIGKFPDGDTHVRVPLLESCRGQDVIIFHRLYPKQNSSLIELFLILDALRYEGAKFVTVVAPYFPYARQDKQTVSGEIASAHVICNLLARAGCGKLVTFDCHFLNEEGEIKHGDLLIKNISLGRELIAHARKYFKGQPFEVIGPDAGAAYLVQEAGGTALVKTCKAYDEDKIAYRNIETLEGNLGIVKGKNVLVVDDMISTGSTMIKTLEKVREAGALQVCCATVHGFFLYDSLDKIRRFSDCIFSTDTITSPQAEVSIKEKLEFLSEPNQTLF